MFRDFPWRWGLYWLAVPNLIVILMWPIGGPPMSRPLLFSAIAAAAATLLPWLLAKRLALVVLTLFVALTYVGRTFNITLNNYEILLPFLREVRPLRSPEYLVAGIVLVLSLVLVWRKAPEAPRPSGAMSWLLAALCVLGIVNLDAMATAQTAGSYHGLPARDAHFDAATRQAGLDRPPAHRRHVVIILVEALGLPASRQEKALFEADWNRPEWRRRYDVERGAIHYYGSTTNGELRELCGVWADYAAFDFARAGCLPARYRRAGYETRAMHGFSGSFFERSQWWPKAGFERVSFAGDLVAEGARSCGGVFPGACDADIPRLIERRLRAADQPQLVYWVTLNAHLPILADESLGTRDCRFGEPDLGLDVPMLCRLFLLHHRLADAITAMALDPDMPPADILIVGDHMPPFFQRSARERFDGSRVPWILLRAKGEGEGGLSPRRAPPAR